MKMITDADMNNLSARRISTDVFYLTTKCIIVLQFLRVCSGRLFQILGAVGIKLC